MSPDICPKSGDFGLQYYKNQNPQRRLGRLERQSDWGRHPPPFHESVMNRSKAGDLTLLVMQSGSRFVRWSFDHETIRLFN